MQTILTRIQRAGDYVLAWSDELDSQEKGMFGGTTASKSTLVKRGSKDRSDDTANVDNAPVKRVKVEGGATRIEDEVRKCWEKGSVSKVNNTTFRYIMVKTNHHFSCE